MWLSVCSSSPTTESWSGRRASQKALLSGPTSQEADGTSSAARSMPGRVQRLQHEAQWQRRAVELRKGRRGFEMIAFLVLLGGGTTLAKGDWVFLSLGSCPSP